MDRDMESDRDMEHESGVHRLCTCSLKSVIYSLLSKVLVKSETTPKKTIFAIFNLLYLNHHNSPTIENLVADI